MALEWLIKSGAFTVPIEAFFHTVSIFVTLQHR